MPREEATPAAAAEATADELAILAARPQRIDLYSWDVDTDEKIMHKVRVAPLTYNQCLAVAEAARDIADKIGLRIGIDDLPRVASEHGPAVRTLLAHATSASEDVIGALPADQFLQLVLKVWEVNKVFFDRLVRPLAKAIEEAVFTAKSGDGPTPSTISEATATASP